MIGKAKWFTRRKYTGWGLAPRTWEGWIYIIIGVSIAAIIQLLPLVPDIKFYLFSIVGLVFIFDIVHIMASIRMDEREVKIEAMAERNASWTMIGTIGVIALYIAEVQPSLTGVQLIPFILAPLITGFFAKALSNFILDRKEL